MPFVLGAIAVLGLAAAAFFGFRILTASNPSSQAAPVPTTTSSSSTTTTPTPSSTSTTTSANGVSPEFAAAQTALQECVAHDGAAKAVVAAVTTGVDHWAAHVQGQTDIDSGAKSYIDVKTNVFGPTKAAGPGDLAAYDGVMGTYEGVAGCGNVASVPAPAELSPKLQACAAREQAIDAYMAAAKAVMLDWRTHLQEMADHTDGHLAGSDAQARWIERWRAAPQHLDPYKAAAAALAAAPACTV
jgi:hypothetical protein